MEITIEAVYDGHVFRPTKPIRLEPNVRVRLAVIYEGDAPPASFLATAESLNLIGPSDWSKNLDDYLYHGKTADES